MYAIIETGGKQYRVTEGDEIRIEKINVADGEQVTFDKVLVLGDGAEAKVGAPYVEGAAVYGDVVETGKGQKVIIFKYKARKTTERNRVTDSHTHWLRSLEFLQKEKHQLKQLLQQ